MFVVTPFEIFYCRKKHPYHVSLQPPNLLKNDVRQTFRYIAKVSYNCISNSNGYYTLKVASIGSEACVDCPEHSESLKEIDVVSNVS
jgi:hypothetical protein